MSRFDFDGDWDYGRYMIWEQAVNNAFMGERAQRVMADLEEALLALPEKKLIEGAIGTKEGSVCAVGALVLHKRVQAGERREDVLAELDRASFIYYTDGERQPIEPWEVSDNTACLGRKYGGMAYAMAWRIAELNDEDCRTMTPEERFRFVLAFVRRAQGKEEIAA